MTLALPGATRLPAPSSLSSSKCRGSCRLSLQTARRTEDATDGVSGGWGCLREVVTPSSIALPAPFRLPPPRKEGSPEEHSTDRPDGFREAHRQSLQTQRREAERLRAVRGARWEQLRGGSTGEMREPVARSSSRVLTQTGGVREAQLSTRRHSCLSGSEAEGPKMSTRTLIANSSLPRASRLPAPGAGLLSRDESTMRQRQREAARRAQVRSMEHT